ncbi:protein FAR1-RELATED SEQUENCE 7-like [Phragmites australis]|uniref:protein FAR1-RELATED SEQUENCE 7-like n=1 Tax=Phragmites australis TaxID=29695 RepID=UPI002D768E45|nr:protein FAR1-RELATED SEQUENCE 7-like [Phragmites australis]XP_062184037.1 protein FAR1-RELATED SEQUENCE 7-like [Phragmites australis]XP_062184038.1 protein FAR1-RELATED SEQUENCE 7-like [Phragmites australis]XP_062184039.1 protein FAR1-RELATED SEQUENCE 7-like [Phragmites australis]XP_062184040.1 protein FAR1-RELATED SEQUENCE 7-like [Phragmites australis]XP_062184042.1 protein FAR1-RELATED SEQUENCE 7-like [Phragmites australis]XP_062184043.1 protein FAR1-RELATED SEQUENCE 7-like [Phragmites a
MSSSAEPPPSPTLAQPAASGSQASISCPPKPNPTITTPPPQNPSVATTAPSLNTTGPTTATAPSWKASRGAITALSRNASGAAAATAAAPSRDPCGTVITSTAVPRNLSNAASAAAAAPRNPTVATGAVALRNPLGTAPVGGVPQGAAPTLPEDYTPRMGQEFDSEHEAYEFYRYYGWKVGFNVRKEYANRSKKTGEITSRKFACSREGYKANEKPGSHTRVLVPDSRTGCNAHLIIRRRKPGTKLEVYAFQPRHNHPLFAAFCMPCPIQWMTMPDAVPPPDYLVNGGESPREQNSTEGGNAVCVGEGQRRPLRTRRQWEMKYGEAGALLNHFQEQSLADPSFYHAVQLDVEDKVANIFWADARMIIDYSQFGDVVAFDVVSRNSISLRHFSSFVGCNSLGEPIVFALALMYDESVESFQWLFETFLHAMSGQTPKTFFSHQDTVIAKAMSLVMPDTSHALCAWNLKHAATKILNQLGRGDCSFIKEFKACINEYEEEMEFLTSWNAMINKHNLCDNVWLQKVFEEKEKWARPYVKGIFSAGMKGTRLNDRLHSEVRDHLRAEVDVILFLRHLQKVINDRRYKELEVEYSSRLKLPYFKIKAPILTQAFEAYTNMIFQLFQEEYEEFQSAYIVKRDESGPCREYTISIVEKEKQYTVYGNPTEQTVSCSCRKFETKGFLCSHALKVLDTMDIKYLPDRYIMKRWTKYARCLTSSEVPGQTFQADKSLAFSSRYQYMCWKYVRLVARASECEESYTILDKFWLELCKKVDDILQKQTSIGTSMTQPDVRNLMISLSSITEPEKVIDKSSKATKVGQKNKTQPRNCIEKGLRKKQKVHSEQPSMLNSLSDASA